MRILVVDDDAALNDFLYRSLKEEKFACDIANSIASARELLDDKLYSLVVLDWNLPDGEGTELLRQMRDEGFTTSVIMLSANSEVDDRVTALDAGADDYLCKPFSMIELLARIRALGRREGSQKQSVITAGELRLDLQRREAYVADELRELTTKEFELLELLMINKNRVMTRFQIMDHICKGLDNFANSNLVDVHVKNLRKKLAAPDIIKAVRGVGYTIKDL